MTSLAEHTRSLVACTIWADDRILAAADGIDDAQYAGLRAQLEHMLGTQRWWHAKWTSGVYAPPEVPTLADARRHYADSHAALRSFAATLTQDGWDRSGQWWLEFGYEQRMALGESITQVFSHAVQHRSEVAVILSGWGRSPGDLDYLRFLRERANGYGGIPSE